MVIPGLGQFSRRALMVPTGAGILLLAAMACSSPRWIIPGDLTVSVVWIVAALVGTPLFWWAWAEVYARVGLIGLQAAEAVGAISLLPLTILFLEPLTYLVLPLLYFKIMTLLRTAAILGIVVVKLVAEEAWLNRLLLFTRGRIASRANLPIRIAMASLLLFFGLLALWRFGTFNGREDLAIFDNVLWLSMRDGLFHSSILDGNYLGSHFSLALVLFLPYYALLPGPQILIVLQTLALVSATFPLLPPRA